MSESYQLFLIFIFAFALIFPTDSMLGVEHARVWILVRILNYYLMFKAWLMYRRLKAGMAKMGMPFPAFKFVPIWERDGNN